MTQPQHPDPIRAMEPEPAEWELVDRLTIAEVCKHFSVPLHLMEPGHLVPREKWEQLQKQQQQ